MELNRFENMIEFDKVKEIWMSFAYTDTVKEMIKNMRPYMSETELLSRIRETSESRQMIETCGNPPVVSLSGVDKMLNAAKRGECLGISDLLEIESALTAISRMKSYLYRGRSFNFPLAFYDENIEVLEDIREAINMSIMNQAISDNASKLLKSLRGDIEIAKDKMKAKADSTMRSNKEYMADSFSTIRNGHVCIPVKKEYKYKISGIVIDKSASGNTIFMEPTSSAKYYEELQQLRIEEENEVQRILYELTDMVASKEEAFRSDINEMEKLDFIFSKGKLSLEMDGCEPIINTERSIELVAARHPLMDKSICVPLDFSIGKGIRGIVITGPNTGGKTVALKTVVLNCMMAQCGLHVPCKEAYICMNSNYLCDIGDGQNISENLSTFSAHITNVLDILNNVNKESLVIMDELGSGTDPLEGMGIAVSILEELKKSEAFFIVTTHYPEVKVYAENTDCIVNARMAFDRENLVPLYKMEIGAAGESCAFYIASRIGMPFRMIERAAKEAYGEEYDITKVGITKSECKKEESMNKKYNSSPRIIKKKKKKQRRILNFTEEIA